ncbi:alcohol dehydrogenase catalytic domain-containing protein [Streptomyces sp. NPDC050287]|uniref:alcohol dehydrogenase catalytic domain-containing protein n=1 Tax=Streptomyces sp. NPDC050287 TaxID=3365608 RepID=UPI0037B5D1BD
MHRHLPLRHLSLRHPPPALGSARAGGPIVRGEWGPQTYPVVPGHEFADIVTEVGSEVTKHAVPDRVGVGCIVNSFRECANCLKGEEHPAAHAKRQLPLVPTVHRGQSLTAGPSTSRRGPTPAHALSMVLKRLGQH